MITLEQAKGLQIGQVIYHAIYRNADGTPQCWRVNGKVKTWKRDSNRIRIPLKRGLYNHGYLDERSLGITCLTEEEALQG